MTNFRILADKLLILAAESPFTLKVYDWSGNTVFEQTFAKYEEALKKGYEALKVELAKPKPKHPDGPVFHVTTDGQLPNGKNLYVGRPSDLEKPGYVDNTSKSVN